MKRFLWTLVFASWVSSAYGVVVADWTFQAAAVPTVTDNTTGPSVTATTGTGTFNGVHASALSDWGNITGNGSTNAYNSSSNWAIGDYWQIAATTTGFDTLSISFDVTSSNTGPRDFKLQTSTTGLAGSYVDSAFTYSLLANGASPNSSWSSGTNQSAYTVSTALPVALNDLSTGYVRLVLTSTVSANGGSLGSGGTSRIDNIIISGSAIAAVPEASSFLFAGLACCASAGVYACRRRQA